MYQKHRVVLGVFFVINLTFVIANPSGKESFFTEFHTYLGCTVTKKTLRKEEWDKRNYDKRYSKLKKPAARAAGFFML